MISCNETGETTTRPYVVMEQDYFGYETKARLSVNNETLEPVSGTVRWKLCKTSGEVLLSGEKEITVPALSVVTLDEMDFHKTDVEHNYLWYEFDGSDTKGSVIFTAPKHFVFEDPKLSVRREGNKIYVKSESYAQKVNIYSPDDDFILSDNFFDMEAGECSVEILEGNPAELSVRSVYDIR
jgi:beta-mannosidase